MNGTTPTGAELVCLYYSPDCADPSKGCDLATSCMAFAAPGDVRMKTFADPASGADRLCMVRTTDASIAGIPARTELLGGTLDSALVCSLDANGFMEPPAGMMCPLGSVPIMVREGVDAGKIMCMTPHERVAANGAAPTNGAAPANGAAPMPSNGAAPMPTTRADPPQFMTAEQMQAEMAAQREVMREAAVSAAREEAVRRMNELEMQAMRRLEQERAALDRMGMGGSAPATAAQVLGRKPAMRVDMPDRALVRYPPYGTPSDSMDERLRLTQFALGTVATSGVL